MNGYHYPDGLNDLVVEFSKINYHKCGMAQNLSSPANHFSIIIYSPCKE